MKTTVFGELWPSFLTSFLEQNDAGVESQGCLFSLASHVVLLPNVSAFYLAAL